MTSTRSVWIERTTCVRSRAVGLSAQCRSSSTSTTGHDRDAFASSDAGGLEQAEALTLRVVARPAREDPAVAGRARERAARARPRTRRVGPGARPARPPRRTDRTPRRTADRRSAPPRDSGQGAPPRPPGERRGRARSPAASCRCPDRRRSPRADLTHPEHRTTGPEASQASPRGRRTGCALAAASAGGSGGRVSAVTDAGAPPCA